MKRSALPYSKQYNAGAAGMTMTAITTRPEVCNTQQSWRNQLASLIVTEAGTKTRSRAAHSCTQQRARIHGKQEVCAHQARLWVEAKALADKVLPQLAHSSHVQTRWHQ